MRDRQASFPTALRICIGAVITITLTLSCTLSRRSWTGTPLARITLAALPSAVVYQPVCVELDTERIDCAQPLLLLEIRGSDTLAVPCQCDPDIPGRLWWTVAPGTGAAVSRDYLLVRAATPRRRSASLQDNGSALDVCLNGRPLLRYQYAPVPPPAGCDSLYTRGGFIHPVWTPQGDVLTRIHPPDHIHHLGIWTPWTKTLFAGRHPDFWNLGDGTGTVRFDHFISRTTGRVFAAFRAAQTVIDLTAPSGEMPVLNEIWNVRAWEPPSRTMSMLIWDLTITQTCAADTPLLLKAYRYGGFGFRGREDWNETNSDYLTSGGETRVNGNGARVRWCRVSGATGSGTGGILFLSHPGNHAHPEPVRIWPQGDVFFGFCPVVNADWLLSPGNSYTRRYRMITFSGGCDSTIADAAWRLFADPPQATITYYKKAENRQ